jgi:hypothetical protein|tara:strand:+ start:203 stop:364 length:162 start_codon:yes stop_codon:yes gene_type:complete
MIYKMKKRKDMMGGGRMRYDHGGQVTYYSSISEKEKKCMDMVGYNTMKSSTDK